MAQLVCTHTKQVTAHTKNDFIKHIVDGGKFHSGMGTFHGVSCSGYINHNHTVIRTYDVTKMNGQWVGVIYEFDLTKTPYHSIKQNTRTFSVQ